MLLDPVTWWLKTSSGRQVDSVDQAVGWWAAEIVRLAANLDESLAQCSPVLLSITMLASTLR